MVVSWGQLNVSVGDVGTLRGYHCGTIPLNAITRAWGLGNSGEKTQGKGNELYGPEAGDLEAIQRARREIGVMNLLDGGGSSGRQSRYSVTAAANYSVASWSGTM